MEGITLIARVVDDLIDTFGELEFLIDFLEKDRSGIGGHGAVEEDIDFFVFGRSGCQSGRLHSTLCLVVCWEKCVALLTQLVCKQHLTTNGLFKNHPPNELFRFEAYVGIHANFLESLGRMDNFWSASGTPALPENLRAPPASTRPVSVDETRTK